MCTTIGFSETKFDHIKCHTNINIQSFNLDYFQEETEIKFVELVKEIHL